MLTVTVLLLLLASLVSIVGSTKCDQDGNCACNFNNGSKINLTRITNESGPRFAIIALYSHLYSRGCTILVLILLQLAYWVAKF